jgi:hypothetical protein
MTQLFFYGGKLQIKLGYPRRNAIPIWKELLVLVEP